MASQTLLFDLNLYDFLSVIMRGWYLCKYCLSLFVCLRRHLEQFCKVSGFCILYSY